MPSTQADREVLAIFEAASLLPVEDRAAYLDDACTGKPEQRTIIEAMLADLEREEPGPLLPTQIEGRRIGVYRIVRALGTGGMGIVYLAERADGRFEKQVALKLVRAGLFAAPSQQRRFLQEQRLMARMEHPHIAQVLDAGVTEGGVPYFVMEYVAGEPLDVYCDTRRLDVEARLRLFAQAAEAVSYAHAHLVVHRDLKPSNVLVEEDDQGRPQVKLLDFGIAKALVDEEAEGEGAITRTEERVLTPEYAAPEQVRGEAVTASADVYALGVVLYELLTGQRPYTFASYTPAEVEQVVSEREPPRPSTAVMHAARDEAAAGKAAPATAQARDATPERLARQLRGDLDTIVLKALQKEPARRYRSAEALLEDVRRHLGGLPVTARPDTAAYLARKFVRRHKVGVFAAVASLLLALGFGAFYTARVTAERDRAEAALQQAERVTAFTTSLFRQADPNEVAGDTITAREILDRGAERVRQELAEEPEVQAAMMDLIGRVYHDLGRYDEAAGLLEEALAVRQQVEGSDAEKGRTLFLLADAVFNQGRYENAEALMRASLEVRRQALGEEHADVAESMQGLAAILYEAGRYDEAETLYREALAIRRKTLGEEHIDVAVSLGDLGSFLDLARHDAQQAEPLLREALAMQKKLLGERHGEVARTMTHLGRVIEARGHYDEAERLQRGALALFTDLFGETHYSTLGTLNNLGRLLNTKGAYEEGEAAHREVLARLEKTQGDKRYGQAFGSSNLSTSLEGQGRYEEAERYRRAALDLFEDIFGREHPLPATMLDRLGRLLRKRGNDAEAEAAFREALALRRQLLDEGAPPVLETTMNLADLCAHRGTYAEAERLYREAVAAAREAQSEDHGLLARGLVGLGRVLVQVGEAAEAESHLRQALTIYREIHPAGHEDLAVAQEALEACLAAQA